MPCKCAAKKAFGTEEWAKYNVNIQGGCEHDCKYCYAKAMAVRMGRSTRAGWKTPAINYAKLLALTSYRKKDGTVMFPSTHDITPGNLIQCLIALVCLLEAGNKVLIVSKPWIRCVKALCRVLSPWKEQIIFRFTIGSMNDKTLAFWEPGAPRFKERLACLQWAYKHGYETSVSCEPMLEDSYETVDLVDKLLPFVTNTLWLGKPNSMRGRTAHCCGKDNQAVRQAVDRLDATQPDYDIKALYEVLRTDKRIRFSASIKKIVGIARPTCTGLDV